MKQYRSLFLRLGAGAIFEIVALLVGAGAEAASTASYWAAALVVVAAAVSGADIIARAVSKLLSGRWLCEETFFLVSAVLAWTLTGARNAVYIAVLMYQAGNFVSSTLVSSTFTGKLDVKANTRDRYDFDDGESGVLVEVKSGERVETDGIVEEGETSMNTLGITGLGTSALHVKPGDKVLAGYMNLGDRIIVRTLDTLPRSALSKLLSRVSSRSGRGGSRAERLSAALNAYLPFAFIAAAIAAFVIPQVGVATARAATALSDALPSAETALNEAIAAARQWQIAACVLLAVASPAATSASIPRNFAAAMAAAAKLGILFRNTSAMDELAKCKDFYIEHAGILSKGEYKLTGVEAEAVKEQTLLLLAYTTMNAVVADPSAAASRWNAYADALSRAYAAVNVDPDAELDKRAVTTVRVTENGVSVKISGERVMCGNKAYMTEQGIQTGDDSGNRTTLYLAVRGRYAGRIMFADEPKPGAVSAMYRLKSSGVSATLFTDETGEAAKTAERALGFTKHSSCLTLDAKRATITTSRATTAYVGTDDVLLKAAGVGITMTKPTLDLMSSGSLAKVTVFSDEPMRIPDALKQARAANDRARFIFIASLACKVAAVILAVAGISSLWIAALSEAVAKVVVERRR